MAAVRQAEFYKFQALLNTIFGYLEMAIGLILFNLFLYWAYIAVKDIDNLQ